MILMIGGLVYAGLGLGLVSGLCQAARQGDAAIENDERDRSRAGERPSDPPEAGRVAELPVSPPSPRAGASERELETLAA